ncbi:MAG: hypothetical protein HFJ58_05900 [Clostridia bacterium]|nr:hypothetical protein [Clostridia bacterium]
MKNKKNKKWYLYWVTSDGYEDCFVVAQNAQAAKSLEFETNGFEWGMVKAERVIEVPERYDKIENYLWIRWSRVNAPEQAKIPNIHKRAYYARHWLLEKLGARWRTIDGKDQMLLLDKVYAHDENGESYTYNIGARALIEDLNEHINFDFNNYSTFEDGVEKILYEMMGIATKECHEIEFYFSNSFVFAVSENQKKKYNTINDFIKGWSKKTLGNLISSIEESFEIKEEWKICIKGFIEMRNQFIHGLTTKERYDINDEWGRRELINFLAIFLNYCEPVKEIAESCFIFSIYFANDKLIDKKENKIPLEETEDVKGKLALFNEIFILKS